MSRTPAMCSSVAMHFMVHEYMYKWTEVKHVCSENMLDSPLCVRQMM
jgi:hypothetical protein